MRLCTAQDAVRCSIAFTCAATARVYLKLRVSILLQKTRKKISCTNIEILWRLVNIPQLRADAARYNYSRENDAINLLYNN